MVQHSYLMSKGMNRITHSKERITPAVVKSTRTAVATAEHSTERLRSSHIWKSNFQLSLLMGKSPVR
jgi:hypothetical protein